MTISTRQHDELLQRPNPKAVHTRSQSGKTFTYLAQHAVRADLIRVFGFDGWEGQVLESELIESKQIEEKKWMAIWRVRYRLTVRWDPGDDLRGPDFSTWVEDAVGSAFGNSQPDTLDQALKSAASDAMKRCAMNLGSRFGIGLYFDGFKGEVIKRTLQGGADTPHPQDVPVVREAIAGAEGDTAGEGGAMSPEGAESLQRAKARSEARKTKGDPVIDALREEIDKVQGGKADPQGDAPDWTLA